MCTLAEQKDMQTEMKAYDSLPSVIKRAFDEAPMKVSVHNTMRLPGFQRARAQMSDAEFARTITAHFAEEARLNHAQDNAKR